MWLRLVVVKRRVGEFILMLRHMLTVPVTNLGVIRLVKTWRFVHGIFLLHMRLRNLSTVNVFTIIRLFQGRIGLVVFLFIEFILGKIILLEGALWWSIVVEKFLTQFGFEF